MNAQYAKPKKVGLFGLSANPPHNGHIAMARYAKDMLGLDEIWWIVANQNPLKSTTDMAPFEDRYDMAVIMTDGHDWLNVSDIEHQSGVNKSFDMLNIVKNCHPNHDFVWIIGGDKLKTFHKWYKWQGIMDMIPIAVMARQGEMQDALNSTALHYAQDIRVTEASRLARRDKGLLVLDNPLVPISSTDIRDNFKNQSPHIVGTHPDVVKSAQQKGLYS